MRIEIAIAKYTLIDLMPAKAVVATVAAPSVLVIGEKVRGAAVEWVPL